MSNTLQRHNKRVLVILLGVFGLMVGLAFASVPLYRWFCQVTGYGGTPQRIEDITYGPLSSEREITVRFNAEVNHALPWRFWPDIKRVTLRLGETRNILYKAKNISARHVSGTANFNVTPQQAGKYFHKIQCFCFSDQVLAPGEEAEFNVIFFVDPALEEDVDFAHANTITLSYTFYPSDSEELYEDMGSMGNMENMENMEQESTINQ